MLAGPSTLGRADAQPPTSELYKIRRPPDFRLHKALKSAYAARAEHVSWCVCEACQGLDRFLVSVELYLWYRPKPQPRKAGTR
jgi:hypothetical protein